MVALVALAVMVPEPVIEETGPEVMVRTLDLVVVVLPVAVIVAKVLFFGRAEAGKLLVTPPTAVPMVVPLLTTTAAEEVVPETAPAVKTAVTDVPLST